MKAAMGGFNEALQAGMKAPKGASPCETAYNATKAMIDVLKQKMPDAASKPMPPKDKFVAACKELSPALQNCLAPAYSIDHLTECQEAQSKMDPATMEKLKKLGGAQ